jgi:hypothetical protein
VNGRDINEGLQWQIGWALADKTKDSCLDFDGDQRGGAASDGLNAALMTCVAG